eukprot:403346215
MESISTKENLLNLDLSENKLSFIQNEQPRKEQITPKIIKDDQVIPISKDNDFGTKKSSKVFSDIFKRPKKVIIDCDPGADNAHAIVLAIYFAKAHNVQILDTKHLHQDSAQKFLIQSAQQYPNEITIIALGPPTNITRAIDEYPNFKSQVRDIVQMGGTHSYQEKISNCNQEHNSNQDSTSAKILLEQLGEKMTIVSKELCQNFQKSLTKEDLASIFEQDNEIARMVRESYRFGNESKGGFFSIYDQIAIAVAFQPEIVLEFVEKQCRIVDNHQEPRDSKLTNQKDQGVDEAVPMTRIITKIDEVALKEYLQDCLSDDPNAYQKRIENNRNQKTLTAYLEAVGMPRHLKLTPNVETLHMVVNRHVLAVPYQNFHFHYKVRQPHSYEFHDLVQRMVIERKGGLCCEKSVFMYYVLKLIGFKVSILDAQLLAFKPYPYSPDKDFTHSMNLVEVEGTHYLVDIGFGHLSLRYPLKIDLNCKDKVQYSQTIASETYSLTRNNDHFLLSFMINDYYNGCQLPFQLYAFKNPIETLNVNTAFERYVMHLFSKEHNSVMNRFFFIGIPTQNGYLNYQYQPKAKKFTATRERLWYGYVDVDVHKFESYSEFSRDVYLNTGVVLPDSSIIRQQDNDLECDQQLINWMNINRGIKSDIINIEKLEQMILKDRNLNGIDQLINISDIVLPQN